jgi:hypothetical protein
MAAYHLELLSPSGTEFGEVERGIAASCPNECVIAIERVVAPVLEERYQRRKEELLRNGPVAELTLYHGARDASAVRPILEDGFKARCNRISAHGKGTYFATSYAYSKHFSGKRKDYRVMLVCAVAVQKLVLGRAGEVLPPEEGDAWVDRLKNPTMYSVPNDQQAVPKYVVQFYVK